MLGTRVFTKSVVFSIAIYLQNCMCLEECYAQEGLEYRLNCTGLVSGSLKQIWWTMSRPSSRRTHQLSKCFPGEYMCQNKHSENIMATNSFTNGQYTSELTIHQVDPDLRGQVINCSEDHLGPYQVERSCLMKIHHFPDSVKCTALNTDEDGVHVSCHAPKVYPGITCQMFEESYRNVTSDGYEGMFKATPIVTTVDYVKKLYLEDETEYFSAACSIRLQKKLSELQRVRVNVYPEDSHHDLVKPLIKYAEFAENNPSMIGKQNQAQEDEIGRKIQDFYREARVGRKKAVQFLSTYRKAEIPEGKKVDNPTNVKIETLTSHANGNDEYIPVSNFRKENMAQWRQVFDDDDKYADTETEKTKITMTDLYKRFTFTMTFQIVLGVLLCALVCTMMVMWIRYTNQTCWFNGKHQIDKSLVSSSCESSSKGDERLSTEASFFPYQANLESTYLSKNQTIPLLNGHESVGKLSTSHTLKTKVSLDNSTPHQAHYCKSANRTPWKCSLNDKVNSLHEADQNLGSCDLTISCSESINSASIFSGHQASISGDAEGYSSDRHDSLSHC